MSREPRHPLDDESLADALRGLAPAIAWPSVAVGAPDPATRVRVAILAGDARATRAPDRRRWWTRPAPSSPRPRRAPADGSGSRTGRRLRSRILPRCFCACRASLAAYRM